MIKVLKFILISMFVVALEGAYFKYIFSRQISEWILYPTSFLAMVVFLFYLRYVAQSISNLIKPN